MGQATDAKRGVAIVKEQQQLDSSTQEPFSELYLSADHCRFDRSDMSESTLCILGCGES